MFKEKFTNELNAVDPSEAVKASVLEKMNNESENIATINSKKSYHKKWITVVAAVLALVIVSVTAFNLPIFKENNYTAKEPIQTSSTQVNETNLPYESVYKKIVEIIELKAEKSNIYSEDTAVDDEEEFLDDDTSEIYSTTNIQVEGVDEGDLVKTDGEYIYSACGDSNIRLTQINVTKAQNGLLKYVSSINFKELMSAKNPSVSIVNISEFYITESKLIVLISAYIKGRWETVIKIFDISDPYNLTETKEVIHSGIYKSSRLIDNNLYVFSSYYVENMTKDDFCSYVPSFKNENGEYQPIDEKNIYFLNGELKEKYLTIFSLDVTSGELLDTKSVLGADDEEYYSDTESVYFLAESSSGFNRYYNLGDCDKTHIIRFDIDAGAITMSANGEVNGRLLNQFSMDEYKENFRIVTTVSKWNSEEKKYNVSNAVYLLDKNLKITGSITDIAKGESVYSARFLGDIAYFVTYHEDEGDPLFAVDLSNPQHPKIISSLQMPGYSSYLHLWEKNLLLGIGKEDNENRTLKLSMFDISDPTKVIEKQREVTKISSDVKIGQKNILISKEKNLIGFASSNGIYYIYEYDNNNFIQKADLKIHRIEPQGYYLDHYKCRGIYIGDYFYVCSTSGIYAYKLSNFEKTAEIDYLFN